VPQGLDRRTLRGTPIPRPCAGSRVLWFHGSRAAAGGVPFFVFRSLPSEGASSRPPSVSESSPDDLGTPPQQAADVAPPQAKATNGWATQPAPTPAPGAVPTGASAGSTEEGGEDRGGPILPPELMSRATAWWKGGGSGEWTSYTVTEDQELREVTPPQPEPEPEPEVEAEAEADTEAVTVTEPEAVTVTEPEAVTVTEPEAEAVTVPEPVTGPEPIAASAAEPALAVPEETLAAVPRACDCDSHRG